MLLTPRSSILTWYVKKPIAIQAKQMNEDFIIKTLEGLMSGKAGDYIITGVEGEQYPVKKEIFETTYKRLANDWITMMR